MACKEKYRIIIYIDEYFARSLVYTDKSTTP